MSSKFTLECHSNSSSTIFKGLAPQYLCSLPLTPQHGHRQLNYPLFLDYAFLSLSSSLLSLLIPSLPHPSSPKPHRAFKTQLGTASPRKPSRSLLGGSDRSVRSSPGVFLALCSSFTGLITSFLVSRLFAYWSYLPHQSVSSSGGGDLGPRFPFESLWRGQTIAPARSAALGLVQPNSGTLRSHNS